MTPLDYASVYLKRGWAPVPVPYRSKNPGYKNWEQTRLTAADLPLRFRRARQNVGILMGEPSNGLLDADLDTPQAIALAPLFLPATGCVFGRLTKPQSHWLYTGRPLVETTKFLDVRDHVVAGKKKRPTLLEIRSTGAQTVCPGSTHEDTGEPIEFFSTDDPAVVDGNELLKMASKLAAATLISRYWPGEGSRHHCANALAGALIRAGWSEDAARQFVVAVAHAGGDEESHNRGKLIDLTAYKHERGQKTTGWKTLVEIVGKDVVTKAQEWLGVESGDPSFASLASFAPSTGNTPVVTAPNPVADTEEPWPDRLDEAAYHGLAGEIVRAIDPHTEADPVAVLIQLLVGFGNAIGRSAHFVADAATHYLNLYAVLVGKTAKGRKGTSWANARLVFDRVAPDWVDNRVLSGLSSGEGLIWQVRDEVTKLVPVKHKGRPTGEYDSVIEHQGVDDKRLLVMESEFATALKVMQRDGNTLSPILRLAWDTGNLRSMVKNSPACATGAHISVIGHITKDELTRYLDRTECANGLGNRFLWLCVQRSKCLPEGGQVLSLDLSPLIERLSLSIQEAREATLITRDPAARELWRDVYPELSEGKAGIFGAMTSRAESQVMRLACAYALLDVSRVVRVEHLRAGLALWRYCEASVKHVFGTATGDPVADDIYRALRLRPDGMTRTEISRQLGNHQDANQILRALSVLAENRKVKCVTERTTGRPAERWFAVGSGGAVQALGCERSELSERSPATREPAKSQPATGKEVA